MAGNRITQLPNVTAPLSGSELLAVVQSNVTKKATAKQILGGGAVDDITDEILDDVSDSSITASTLELYQIGHIVMFYADITINAALSSISWKKGFPHPLHSTSTAFFQSDTSKAAMRATIGDDGKFYLRGGDAGTYRGYIMYIV